MDRLFEPIDTLKGVASARAEMYRKLGIKTPYDLLYHIPRRHLDYSEYVSVSEAVIDDVNVLKLKILRKSAPRAVKNNMTVYKAVATDGEEEIAVVFFNNIYAWEALDINEEYYMYGKVTSDLYSVNIMSPQYIRTAETMLILPIYKLTTGLTNAMVRTNIKEAIRIMYNEPFEILPQSVLDEYELLSLDAALGNIHFPMDMEAYELSKQRLAFDELLILQVGIGAMRERSRRSTACVMDKTTSIDGFFKALPFEMTNAQKKALSEILADLCYDRPMNRLLQGDVGSGKTAVAAAACAFTAQNGMQTALMAPTEILATQHYNTLSSFLEPLGMRVCLLTGSMAVKKKATLKEGIADGSFDVIVGTHAIIQKDTVFRRLGLVITDEQHRFGVGQRSTLAEKGDSPHKLVMSATPIPRTLALIIYGDLDVSIINELPKGRKPISTYAVTGKLRERAFGFVRQHLDAGRQVYIVCPMIEDSDSDLLAVKSYAKYVSETILNGYTVGLLHGRMSAAEKEKTMKKFKKGDIQVLVCTTVVEVGVDVPNASVIVIENAERFGLSQLHQLRGRVGRGVHESSCILITDNTKEECVQRMKIVSRTTDGFVISEEDLKLRGPGDFFGNRQHGLPPMKIADIACNTELVNMAQKCAADILKKDPKLELPEHHAIRLETVRLFNSEIIG